MLLVMGTTNVFIKKLSPSLGDTRASGIPVALTGLVLLDVAELK
jgi:hypothetical protein